MPLGSLVLDRRLLFFSFDRLDNLLLLLDTGSSTSLRTTAAQNIAQLAAKSVTSDVTFDEDIKTTRHVVPRSDPSAWAELMAVVARVSPPVIVRESPSDGMHSLDSSLFALQVT